VPFVQGYVTLSNLSVGSHSVPFWRSNTEYFVRFAHRSSGGGLTFNSCMDPSAEIVCSGRGSCLPFDPHDVANPVLFCQCHHSWGDPECTTPRKRQSIAWLLSLFMGPFGADEIYLGWALPAVLKILSSTLGIFNITLGFDLSGLCFLLIPWLFDVVRIGSAPVRSAEYGVNPDLPRWAFAFFTLIATAFIAMALVIGSVQTAVLARRRQYEEGLYGTAKAMA